MKFFMPPIEQKIQNLNSSLLTAKSLVLKYGEYTALNEVSLSLKGGEITTLLGPNGAGKTSFVKVLTRLLKPSKGKIAQASGPRIGYVAQDIGLYPTLPVSKNLRFFSELNGHSRFTSHPESRAIVEHFHLNDLWEKPVGQLSGGQRRLVHIAAAVLHLPNILILDEPTAALDKDKRDAVLEFVSGYAKSGRAVLYTTHHLDEVEAISDRLLFLVGGQIQVDQEYNAFVNESAKAFIAVTTEIDLREELKVMSVSGNEYIIESENPSTELPMVLATVQRLGGNVRAIRIITPNLEGAITNLLKEVYPQ